MDDGLMKDDVGWMLNGCWMDVGWMLDRCWMDGCWMDG